MPSFFTREAAASSWVDSGLEAQSATFAPPAASTCISAAVSVVTWRQAATRTPLSGFSFANRAPMERSTGMSFLAHSTRSLPAAASFGSLTSYPLLAAIPQPLSSLALYFVNTATHPKSDPGRCCAPLQGHPGSAKLVLGRLRDFPPAESPQEGGAPL